MSNYDSEILAIIKNHPDLKGHDINKGTDFRQDLGLDSLVIAEITIQLEDTLNIQFQDTLLTEVHTVNDLIVAVEKIINSPQVTTL